MSKAVTTRAIDDLPAIPSRRRAALNRFEREFGKRPDGPAFAAVFIDDDGRPWSVSRANRTGLTVAGLELLMLAVDLEKNDPCVCANCDDWTARARAAIIAAGGQVDPAN